MAPGRTGPGRQPTPPVWAPGARTGLYTRTASKNRREDMRAGMRIEIWADVVCPWAYIGKRRLEAALADPALSARDIEVVWRPYRINPTAPPQAVPVEPALRDPLVDATAARCAPDPATAEDQVPISRIAAAEGLGPAWGAAWRSSSHDAHRLLALAHEHGGGPLQDTVAEHLMRAHFVEGHDISARDTLRTIATTAGFAEGAALIDTDAADRAVRELRLIGKARGIKTSPTIVVGDRALAAPNHPTSSPTSSPPQARTAMCLKRSGACGTPSPSSNYATRSERSPCSNRCSTNTATTSTYVASPPARTSPPPSSAAPGTPWNSWSPTCRTTPTSDSCSVAPFSAWTWTTRPLHT